MVALAICWIIGSVLGAIGYYMWCGASALINGPEPLPEWEQAAGRIHLFAGDRYFNIPAPRVELVRWPNWMWLLARPTATA